MGFRKKPSDLRCSQVLTINIYLFGDVAGVLVTHNALEL